MKLPMTTASRTRAATSALTPLHGAGARKLAGTATSHAPIRSLSVAVRRAGPTAPDTLGLAAGVAHLRSRRLAGRLLGGGRGGRPQEASMTTVRRAGAALL